MSEEPRNEEQICGVIVGELGKLTGWKLTVTERPDKVKTNVERRQQAVEMICSCDSGQTFAIEHTRIESFPDQIADGKSFEDLLGPFESALKGVAPGRFSLIVRVGATTGIRKADRSEIRTKLANWIAEKMVAWERSRREDDQPVRAAETPAGVPFEVTLVRWHRNGDTLLIARTIPDDLEETRHIRRAALHMARVAGAGQECVERHSAATDRAVAH
jgi:hypothetical protein